MNAAAPRGRISIAGIFLIVVGALLAIPSGACTGLFAYMVVSEWGDAAEAASTMGMVLMIAGLPLAGGIVLIWAGFKLRQSPAEH